MPTTKRRRPKKVIVRPRPVENRGPETTSPAGPAGFGSGSGGGGGGGGAAGAAAAGGGGGMARGGTVRRGGAK